MPALKFLSFFSIVFFVVAHVALAQKPLNDNTNQIDDGIDDLKSINLNTIDSIQAKRVNLSFILYQGQIDSLTYQFYRSYEKYVSNKKCNVDTKPDSTVVNLASSTSDIDTGPALFLDSMFIDYNGKFSKLKTTLIAQLDSIKGRRKLSS